MAPAGEQSPRQNSGTFAFSQHSRGVGIVSEKMIGNTYHPRSPQEDIYQCIFPWQLQPL